MSENTLTPKQKRLVADLIESNYGYSNRDGYWPLEWNVCLSVDTDWDTAYAEAMKQAGEFGLARFSKVTLARAILKVREEYNADRMWEWIQADMFESLNNDDGLRTCTPEVLAKWGLVEPENGLYFDVKLELRGRGGKHLVLAKFEGSTLEGYSSTNLADSIRADADNDELRAKYDQPCKRHKLNGIHSGCTKCEELLDAYNEVDDNEWSDLWLRKLGAYIEEGNRMFTQEAAAREFQYQLGWEVGRMIEDAASDREAENARIKSEREGVEAMVHMVSF